jgi:hypothetical protein
VTTYTLASARELLPEARRRVEQLAGTVADLRRLAREAAGPDAPAGAVPDAKAAEAIADDQLAWFRDNHVEVKGIAPALLDFPAPAVRDGHQVEVLLCWREGEDDIAHFHPRETGYLGREPLEVLDEV